MRRWRTGRRARATARRRARWCRPRSTSRCSRSSRTAPPRARRPTRHPRCTTTSGENGSTTIGAGRKRLPPCPPPPVGVGVDRNRGERRATERAHACPPAPSPCAMIGAGAVVGMHRDDRVASVGAEVRQRDRLIRGRERRRQRPGSTRRSRSRASSRSAPRRPGGRRDALSANARVRRRHRPRAATITRIRIGARRLPRIDVSAAVMWSPAGDAGAVRDPAPHDERQYPQDDLEPDQESRQPARPVVQTDRFVRGQRERVRPVERAANGSGPVPPAFACQPGSAASAHSNVPGPVGSELFNGPLHTARHDAPRCSRAASASPRGRPEAPGATACSPARRARRGIHASFA